MKISFENPDKVNGLLTITVEEADYQASVEKTLKDYRKKANYPGFRPGMVPMGQPKWMLSTNSLVNRFTSICRTIKSKCWVNRFLLRSKKLKI